MSIEASATESQRADSSATENLPATKSSDDTLHRGWPQWRRSLQAKFDGVVKQQEEHELIVSILRRIQEVLSTGDWKDSPSSLEEVTNLVEFVSTCNVSNNYVRSQISQIVRHAGRVGITVTTQPGATWYTCHQCSRAFKTWSLCLEHLRTEGHMGVTAATTDRGQIERMKNLCAEDEPTMVDSASRVSAPDSKIKRRVGLVQAVVHPSLEKLAKNVLHFAIHGTAPQTTEYLKKHAFFEKASIDGFEQNSAAEPTARPSAAQKRVSGKSTDQTQRDDVEAPLQQPSQKATPDHHDGATHRQHQQHQLEERHKQPEIVQQQSKDVHQSQDGGQRPRPRRQQKHRHHGHGHGQGHGHGPGHGRRNKSHHRGQHEYGHTQDYNMHHGHRGHRGHHDHHDQSDHNDHHDRDHQHKPHHNQHGQQRHRHRQRNPKHHHHNRHGSHSESHLNSEHSHRRVSQQHHPTQNRNKQNAHRGRGRTRRSRDHTDATRNGSQYQHRSRSHGSKTQFKKRHSNTGREAQEFNLDHDDFPKLGSSPATDSQCGSTARSCAPSGVAVCTASIAALCKQQKCEAPNIDDPKVKAYLNKMKSCPYTRDGEQPQVPAADAPLIRLECFYPLEVANKFCDKLVRDIKKWKRTHLQTMDVNSDNIPSSFQSLILSQRCSLLFSVVDELYLRLCEQISFFSYCKLKSQPPRREKWQAKIQDGVVSLKTAATECKVRFCEAVSIFVGKKSKRKALRNRLRSLLNSRKIEHAGCVRHDEAQGCSTGSWRTYKALEKVEELAQIIQENEDVFREVDERNSSKAMAGEDGESVVMEYFLNECNVPRDLFWTECDLKRLNAEADKRGDPLPFARTPDFLFKQVVNINGRCVRWVDSKNTLILQNLTIPPQVAKFRQQINAYVDSFGPGLVIWHACFFQRAGDLYDQPHSVFELSIPKAKYAVIAAGHAMKVGHGVTDADPDVRAVLAFAELKLAVAGGCGGGSMTCGSGGTTGVCKCSTKECVCKCGAKTD